MLAVILAAAAFLFILASVAFALYVYYFVERKNEGGADLSLPSIRRLLLKTGMTIISAVGKIATLFAAVFIVGGINLLNRLPRRKSKY